MLGKTKWQDLERWINQIQKVENCGTSGVLASKKKSAFSNLLPQRILQIDSQYPFDIVWIFNKPLFRSHHFIQVEIFYWSFQDVDLPVNKG